MKTHVGVLLGRLTSSRGVTRLTRVEDLFLIVQDHQGQSVRVNVEHPDRDAARAMPLLSRVVYGYRGSYPFFVPEELRDLSESSFGQSRNALN